MVTAVGTHPARTVAATAWSNGKPVMLAVAPPRTQQISTGFAAILLVSLLGGLLLAAVIVGARYVRRLNRRPLRPSQMASDRWYEKPLVDPDVEHAGDESPDVE